ncbi:MAG: hypothetical protein MUE51_07165 [Thermoleophilia bacterium]|nr:hypothetical protein [Thermoleophilia bacterium]
MSAPDDQARRVAVILLVAVVAVFVIALVALAVGRLEIAGLAFLALCGGWFAMRSWQKRRGAR